MGAALVRGLDHTCLPQDSGAVVQMVAHGVYLYHCLRCGRGLVTGTHWDTAGLQVRVVVALFRAIVESEDTSSVSLFLHCLLGLLSMFSRLCYPCSCSTPFWSWKERSFRIVQSACCVVCFFFKKKNIWGLLPHNFLLGSVASVHFS